MSNIDDNELECEFERIAAALHSLKPNPLHRKRQLFKRLHPVILEMIEAQVTQKAILATLAQHGLKLHPSLFKEWMGAEAEARSGNNGTDIVVT